MTSNTVSVLLDVKPERIRKSKGVFRYHQSYFYGVTKSADALVNRVKEKIPNAIIIDSGNHFHEFVGGAKSGSAQDSYLWVKFTVA